jgi:hypothetical protein
MVRSVVLTAVNVMAVPQIDTLLGDEENLACTDAGSVAGDER